MAKVLIVDDSPFYQKIYQKKLEEAKYEVHVALNGEDGLIEMKNFNPDIVFMDMMMPKMDGFAAIQKAKTDEQLKHIPIVALTGLSSEEDTSEVLKMGAVDIIIKSEVQPDAIVAK